MSLHAVNLLGIKITNSTEFEILEEIRKYLRQIKEMGQNFPKSGSKSLIIVTPNPEQIMLAQKNPHFRDILNRADIAIPDGVGIVWASRFLTPRVKRNTQDRISQTIPGISFMESLVASSVKWGVPVALIGGRAGVAVKAFECLSVKAPGLQGFGSGEITLQDAEDSDGIDGENSYIETSMKDIIRHKVRIIFVGLGAPKQEYFIERLARKAQNKSYPLILMSVGGSFDEIAGRIPRAPRWVGQSGLKWLWRLILQPWRWRRQIALLQFAALVIGKRIR